MDIENSTPQEQARTLLRLAISAVERAETDRAVRYVRGALAVDPDSQPAHLWEQALTGVDPATWLVDLDQALAANPDDALLTGLLAWHKERVNAAATTSARRPFRAPWAHLMPASRDESEDPLLHAASESRPVSGMVSPVDEAELPDEPGLPPRPRRSWRRPLALLAMVLMLMYILLGAALIVASLVNADWQTRARDWLSTASVEALELVALPTATATPTAMPTATATAMPSATPTSTTVPTATATLAPTLTPTPDWVTEVYAPLPLEGKWIEVDLSEQMLYAYEGTERVFESLASTGKEATPTRRGRFTIQTKYLAQDMGGPGYYLPNVQWVQYFYINFALHGAYWHDKWGTPTSHGCVNLVNEDAEWLFAWTDPVLPEGALRVSASSENPGTPVLVHE